MRTPSQIAFATFTIDVVFSSGGEPFATETYVIEAADWYRAQRDALERSVNSVYDNGRIPDLTREVVAR
jgi:hypothetical protein